MPRIPSPTLLQLMKAVAFAGVACTCVVPLIRTWQMGAVNGGAWSGLVAIGIFGGVAIPIAWTGLAILLIRRGAWRDQLITSFLLGSVSVALGFALFSLFAFAIPEFWWFYRREGFASAIIKSTPVLHAMVICVLGAACSFLSRRLWRGYHPIVPEAQP